MITDWINNLRFDGVSACVSTRIIKNKAIQVNRNYVGERFPPSDLAENTKCRFADRLVQLSQAVCFSIGVVTRQAQELPSGWPETEMASTNEWRGQRHDVPSALETRRRNLGPGGERSGGRQWEWERSRGSVGAEAQALSPEQTANMDQTPVRL